VRVRACACVRACVRACVCPGVGVRARARADYWLAFPSCKSLAKIIEKKSEKKLAMHASLSFTSGEMKNTEPFSFILSLEEIEASLPVVPPVSRKSQIYDAIFAIGCGVVVLLVGLAFVPSFL
jgi:hypothetical protein